jgi:hypothetical protein
MFKNYWFLWMAHNWQPMPYHRPWLWPKAPMVWFCCCVCRFIKNKRCRRQVTAVYNRLRPPEEKSMGAAARGTLSQIGATDGPGPGNCFETLVIDGDPAGVIVDTAEAQDVDLIVMSTHGRGGLARWWLGSVTEKVLRATRPILIVSSDRLPTRTLVTLDGSTAAEAALEPAR